jgi:hypothetical protein
MSAGNLLIPFDFNPVETSIKTSSYTIPEGRYAFVTPHCSSCTVNSSSLLTVTRSITTSATVGIGLSTASIFFRAFTGSQNATKNLFLGAKNLIANAATTTPIDIYICDGRINIISGSIPSTGTAAVLGDIQSKTYSLVTGSANALTVSISEGQGNGFWVPSGTVLGGSGSFAWQVTEYNVIQ